MAEQLGFVTPIYHLNISEQGVACLPVLKVRSSRPDNPRPIRVHKNLYADHQPFLSQTSHRSEKLIKPTSRTQENWSPAINTVQVLSSVRQLLAKPNPDDPVRADVASLYLDNRYMRPRNLRRFKI